MMLVTVSVREAMLHLGISLDTIRNIASVGPSRIHGFPWRLLGRSVLGVGVDRHQMRTIQRTREAALPSKNIRATVDKQTCRISSRSIYPESK